MTARLWIDDVIAYSRSLSNLARVVSDKFWLQCLSLPMISVSRNHISEDVRQSPFSFLASLYTPSFIIFIFSLWWRVVQYLLRM